MPNKVAATLCLLILIASCLIPSALTVRMSSAATALTTIMSPCDFHKSWQQPKTSAKPVQSAKRSLGSECLGLRKRYPAEASTPSGAQELLKKAIALDPADAEAYKHLASAHLSKNEEFGFRLSEEEYCLIETLCRTAISLQPDDPESYLLLGKILNQETYYEFRSDDAAIEALKRAIELKPAWPDAYCELAHAHYLRKQYEKSAAAYTVEWTLRRENEVQLGQINSAILDYQKHHETRDAFVVAEIFIKLGRYHEALSSLQHAEGVDPEDDVIRFWIGKTFLSLGDIESAKREQKLLVELCKTKDKFFVTQCEGYAHGLLDAIEQRSQ